MMGETTIEASNQPWENSDNTGWTDADTAEALGAGGYADVEDRHAADDAYFEPDGDYTDGVQFEEDGPEDFIFAGPGDGTDFPPPEGPADRAGAEDPDENQFIREAREIVSRLPLLPLPSNLPPEELETVLYNRQIAQEQVVERIAQGLFNRQAAAEAAAHALEGPTIEAPQYEPAHRVTPEEAAVYVEHPVGDPDMHELLMEPLLDSAHDFRQQLTEENPYYLRALQQARSQARPDDTDELIQNRAGVIARNMQRNAEHYATHPLEVDHPPADVVLERPVIGETTGEILSRLTESGLPQRPESVYADDTAAADAEDAARAAAEAAFGDLTQSPVVGFRTMVNNYLVELQAAMADPNTPSEHIPVYAERLVAAVDQMREQQETPDAMSVEDGLAKNDLERVLSGLRRL